MKITIHDRSTGSDKMRYLMAAPLIILSIFFLTFPATAFSEVKIFLKNGREITADSCRESGIKLVCEKAGGTFEIGREDVLDIKEIYIERQVSDRQEEQPAAESADKSGETKTTPEVKGPTSTQGTAVRGLTPEARTRLDQITKRKIELQRDKEALITERAQLHEDVKNAGVIRSQEKYDSLTKRISDLDEKIRSFNKEVDDLNAEEKRILEGPAPPAKP